MKDTISDWDILLIRQCKKNHYTINNFRKIISKRNALAYEYVTKADVVYFLTKIVLEYNLVRDWTKFILEELNPKKWWTKEEKPYIDNLLEELISKIACAEVKKFPRYRSPAWFRNKYNTID